MRDPKRIDDTLEVIEKIWKRYPDLRLTQLIMNVCKPGGPFFISRMYNLEDDELVEDLKKQYPEA